MTSVPMAEEGGGGVVLAIRVPLSQASPAAQGVSSTTQAGSSSVRR